MLSHDGMSTFYLCSCLDSKPHRFRMFNYLDDFIGVSPPKLATSHFGELGELLHHLGLEESVDKSCPPSPVMTC